MTREAFHAQLDALAEHSAAMCELTGRLLEQATGSLCDTDETAAQRVVSGAVELDRQRGHAEELMVQLHRMGCWRSMWRKRRCVDTRNRCCR